MAKERENSFGSGSETIFEFYCEFCNEEGLHIEAAGHCTECDEYLCESCVVHHGRSRFSRCHNILDKENMPKDKPPSPDRTRKNITTMCKHHKVELVKYYCKIHDELTCNRCFVKDHKACSYVIDIIETSNSIFDDNEYKEFVNTLKSLETLAHKITTKSREHLDKSKRYCTEAKEAVSQFRDEINSILDDIESNLDTKVDAILTMDVSNMDTLENTCCTMQRTIDKISSELESLKKDNRVCQAYVRMKESSADIEKIKQMLTEAEKSNTINAYTFVSNSELIDFLRRPDMLGLISMDNKIELQEQNTSPVIKTISAPSFVLDIDVRSLNDVLSCIITGSAVLSNRKLVLVDHFNDKLKLVNTHYMKIISNFKIPGRPWDVTTIKEDQVAVTVYSKNTILILKVTDTLTLEREIKVRGTCRGIAFSRNELIVTYVDPPHIEIMDLYGNVSNTMDTNMDGNQLFRHPQYVVASNDGDILYVSDYSANRIISLSRDGFVKTTYTDTTLTGPEKVCIDRNGNVYVCGFNSYNIHMLTQDCTKISVILTQTDGLTNKVYSVSHCRQTGRLYIGLDWCDKVKVYQLS